MNHPKVLSLNYDTSNSCGSRENKTITARPMTFDGVAAIHSFPSD